MGFLMAVAVGLSLPAGAADPPAKPDPGPLKKVPPGAVVIVVKSPQEGEKIIPDHVMISKEEYQKLLDQIDQLKAQLKPEKPIAPGACEITGDATGTVAHLTLQFKVRTVKANTLVALGCALGKLNEARLDDQLPNLQPADDGYVALVEKLGDHVVRFLLDVPTTPKGGDRSFDLDLPRAPITTVELDFPEKVKEVRVTTDVKDPRGPNRVVETQQGEGKTRKLEKEPIGAASRLEVSWKSPTTIPSATPLLAAESRTIVRVGETQVLTEIDLKLLVLRGQTSQWQLLLPPGATLAKPTWPDDRLAGYEPPSSKNPAHVLKLHGSSSEPLMVRFLVNQPRQPEAPRAGGKPVKAASLAVGPILVAGASEQHGTLLVTAPPELRTAFQIRGEPLVTVTQRDLTDEDRREARPVAAFQFIVHNADAKAIANPQPFLNLEVETVKELAAARARHTLRLTDRGWTLTSDIDVTPRRTTGVERLELMLPAGYELDTRKGAQVSGPGGSAPTTVAARMDHNPADRSLTIELSSRRMEPFRVTIEGFYPHPGGVGSGPWQAAFQLPLPVKVEDQGGQVSVAVPRDMELVNPGAEEPEWTNLPPGKSEFSWPTDRLPEQAAVAWRSNRPEAAAVIIADVRLGSRQGQVTMRVWPPSGPTEPVLLWLPDGLGADRVRMTPRPHDDKLLLESPEVPKRPGLRPWLISPSAEVNKDHPLILEYAFALADFELMEPAGDTPATRYIKLPLIRAGKMSWADIKVRLIAPPGITVGLVRGPWDEQPLEMGEGSTLPSLVIRNSGHKVEQAPVLGLRETGLGSGTIQIDRALVQATVAETGTQHCRARFLINHLGASSLDVELPGPTAVASLQAFLRLPGETAPKCRGSRWMRRPSGCRSIPSWCGRGPCSICRTSCRPPRDAPWRALLETTLTPPVPRGGLGRTTVRWQVLLPPAWVAAVTGGGAVEQTTWGWRGWLLAPRAALGTADLEDWFLNGFEPGAGPESSAAGEPNGVVCWQGSLTPMQVMHVPQQGWLLLCSLGLLAAGLVLYLLLLRGGMLPGREDPRTAARSARVVFWSLLITLAVVTAAGLLFWPSGLAR